MPTPAQIAGTASGGGVKRNLAGVHPVAILTALELEAANWPAASRKAASKARRAKILALKADGWKQAAIAAELGISDSLVSQIILKRRHHGKGVTA